MTNTLKTPFCLLLILALCLSLAACSAAPEKVEAMPAATATPVAETPENTPESMPAQTPEAQEAAAQIDFKDTPYKDSYTPSNVSFYENSDLYAFKTKTLSGEDYDSKVEFAKAKVTMITLWTTTCGVCVREMPVWEKLSQEYAGAGFQIVGICCGAYDGAAQAIERAKDISSQAGVTYTQLSASNEMFAGFIADVMYVPTTIFVDSEGYEICPSVIGAMEEQGWIDLIETLMHEQA